MHKTKIIWSFFILLFSASYSMANIEDTIHESFNVSAGGTLFLDSDLGSIEVQATETSKVIIDVIRIVRVGSRSAAAKILEDFEVTFDQNGKDVTVSGRYPTGHNRLFHSDKLQVRYVISVPREYNLDLKTSGGSISVDALKGSIISETSGGSLRFGQIDGPVRGKTSGGSISLDGCVGDADIHTSGGSIHLGNVNGNVEASTSGGSIDIAEVQGHVVASTSGGGIRVEDAKGYINAETSGGSISAKISEQPDGDCRLSTSGGGIKVFLSSSIHIDVDAGTSGGHVNTDFDVTIHGKFNENSLKGAINGGGPLLYLRTSGGNINIDKI